MELTLRPLALPREEPDSVEVVERKGLGHPDTLCDMLAEALSLSLSRFYRERFGLILHHNVDKVL
ncbi:MAG TPA: methionine adenosyltransferase, partial [Alphaproteobacteria bacterium]|nr:methionine adenosyltransferase [Alphaproteobacteria bacterium]